MWRFMAAALVSTVLTIPTASVPPASAAAPADVPTFAPGVTARPGGGFQVAYRTSAGNVALRSYVNGTWSVPSGLGGRVTGGPALFYAAGNLHVYGRGTDSLLWQRVRKDGTWGAWTKLGGPGMSSAPAAVGRPDGRVDLFFRDSADQLQTRAWRPGVGWSAWGSLGGVLHSAPAATITGADSLVVATTRSDNAVWTRTLTGATWSAWASLGGRTYSQPGISYEPTGGRIRVVIRDAITDRLHLRSHSGTWSGWQEVGGRHVDGPGLAAADTTTAVVARGRDGAFWTRTVSGTSWSGQDRAWVIGLPAGVPSALRGKNVTRIPTTAKVAALTFDGGAGATGVPSIRATLQRERVPATFFLIGDFARGFPISTNLVSSAGFRIANHSDSHPDFTKIPDATARAEVTNARNAIFNTGGGESRPLFRFPYGAYTASDITLVNNLGYVAVGWTVDSLGWKGTSGGQSVTSVVNRVLAAATPGMIVLMHVGANPNDGTVLDADALPQIIRGLRDRGYSFTTLDALLS